MLLLANIALGVGAGICGVDANMACGADGPGRESRTPTPGARDAWNSYAWTTPVQGLGGEAHWGGAWSGVASCVEPALRGRPSTCFRFFLRSPPPLEGENVDGVDDVDEDTGPGAEVLELVARRAVFASTLCVRSIVVSCWRR